MNRSALNPDTVATPEPPYSQVVLATGTLVAVSGQGPLDRAGHKVGADDLSEQARQVFRNIGHCLEAAGCGFADVIKVTTYLVDLDDFAAYNDVYREFFTDPYPARTTVRADLIGTRIEVDALAVRGQAG
jgi:2-iminobutanoate/2-iminopropanoate deaminase